MIERIRRWLGVQETDQANGGSDDMDEKLQSIGYADTPELEETKALLRESRRKSEQASARLEDYQKRIRIETEKRVQMISGSRSDDT